MLESHWEECVGSGCNLTDELADIYLITPENHKHNSGFVSGNKVACLLAADAYFGFIASQIRLYLRRHICMSWSNTGKKKTCLEGEFLKKKEIQTANEHPQISNGNDGLLYGFQLHFGISVWEYTLQSKLKPLLNQPPPAIPFCAAPKSLPWLRCQSPHMRGEIHSSLFLKA